MARQLVSICTRKSDSTVCVTQSVTQRDLYLTPLQPPYPKLILEPFCCNTAVSRSEWCVDIVSCTKERRRSSGDCNTSTEVTVSFCRASHPVRRFPVQSPCVTAYTVQPQSRNSYLVTVWRYKRLHEWLVSSPGKMGFKSKQPNNHQCCYTWDSEIKHIEIIFNKYEEHDFLLFFCFK